jgi:hypothetical protein
MDDLNNIIAGDGIGWTNCAVALLLYLMCHRPPGKVLSGLFTEATS